MWTRWPRNALCHRRICAAWRALPGAERHGPQREGLKRLAFAIDSVMLHGMEQFFQSARARGALFACWFLCARQIFLPTVVALAAEGREPLPADAPTAWAEVE